MKLAKSYGKTTGSTLNNVECRLCGQVVMKKYFLTRHWPKHSADSFQGQPCVEFQLKEGRRLMLDKVAIDLGQPNQDPPNTTIHAGVEKIRLRFEMATMPLNKLLQFITGNKLGVSAGLVSQPCTTILLYGPPGTGKSTIASLICETMSLETKKIDSMGVKDLAAGQSLGLENWLETDPAQKALIFEEIESGGLTTLQRLLKPIIDKYPFLLIMTANKDPDAIDLTTKFRDRIQLTQFIGLADSDLKKLIKKRIDKSLDFYNLQENPQADDELLKTAKESFRKFERTLNNSAFRSSQDKLMSLTIYKL